MNKTLVSVCIPCHNAAPYLGQALASIFQQTWQSTEVIVVNDGSTDDSAEILSHFDSPRLKIINASFKSAAKSRNLALANAQGDLIKFFDADDVLSPSSIESQIHRLAGHSNSVAYSRWGRFYNDDIKSFSLSPHRVWRDMNATDWLVEAWYDAHPMMQPGLFLIPRSLLDVTGGWDEQLTLIDDFEFFARVLCHSSQVLFSPESTLFYRSGLSGSLSGQKTRQSWESACRSLLSGTSHLLALQDDVKARRSCANVLQNFIYAVYPNYPDLRLQIESRISELGGSDLDIPAGPRFRIVAQFCGWKCAKTIQHILGRS